MKSSPSSSGGLSRRSMLAGAALAGTDRKSVV